MEKILLAIPAYGGQVHVFCFKSVVRLLQSSKVTDHYQLLVISIHNEALISRARQDLAKYALDHNVDRLFFIDADISFTPEQFLAVVEADKDVIGGTYMMKTLQNPRLNFNFDGEMTQEMFRKYGAHPASLAGFRQLQKEFAQNPVVKARHVPTGFLCIKTSALRKLAEKVPAYLSNNTGADAARPEDLERMKVPELFPISIQQHILESEDWGFCRLCAENGIDVFLHSGVVVEHVGALTYHPALFWEK